VDGPGEELPFAAPVDWTDLPDRGPVDDISVDTASSCAAFADGRAVCWGTIAPPLVDIRVQTARPQARHVFDIADLAGL